MRRFGAGPLVASDNPVGQMSTNSLRLKLACSILAMFAGIVLCNAARADATSVSEDERRAISAIVLKNEKATLETFRSHDKATYLKLCLPEFYEITADGGINSLQDQLTELDDYVLGEYRMEDVVITVLSATAALIRYRISAEYTYKGKKLPVTPMLASAVWIQRDGQWRAAIYQEARAEAHR